MILDQIKALIAAQFEVSPDSVTEDTDFLQDLEADSLDIVELTMEVEEKFGLEEISEETIQSIRTVRDLVAYVEAHRD
jgi:acyl carrier protein